jgi:cell division protein FtsW
MARTLKSDRMLFLLTMLLVGVSVVMVYSASSIQAAGRYEVSAEHFLYRQMLWAIVGFGVMFVVMRVDYHIYQQPIVIWPMVGVTAVLLVVVLFGAEVNGATRWISVSFINLQPSEIAKLTAIIFTAAVLEWRMHRIGDVTYSVTPIAVVACGFVGLILLEPDLGTSVVLILVVVTMLFAAGLRLGHLVTAALVLVPAAAALILSSPYRRARFMAFFDPEGSHQIRQSYIAIGSGGVFGLGLFDGVQKLFYLPEAHTDFIFAVIAEELGLVGTTCILICFLVLGWRGLRVSLLARDRFGALLALGITMMVTLQALLNITVVTGLAPTKGLPLPFISNGGSSLLINMAAMGILLNVSQQASATAAATATGPARWVLGEQEA